MKMRNNMLANARGVRGPAVVEPVTVVQYGCSTFVRDANGRLTTMGVPVEAGAHLPKITVDMATQFVRSL